MEFYLGGINAMAINFAPYGWMTCQGQILNIQQYAALFSLIGTSYGGNGTSTFGLPDLQGRMIIGQGHNPVTGQTYTVGQKGGTVAATLSLANLPVHTHTTTVAAVSYDQSIASPKGAYPGGEGSITMYSQNAANATLNPASVTVGVAGGSTPIATLSPFQCMFYNICLSGLFPQRP